MRVAMRVKPPNLHLGNPLFWRTSKGEAKEYKRERERESEQSKKRKRERAFSTASFLQGGWDTPAPLFLYYFENYNLLIKSLIFNFYFI